MVPLAAMAAVAAVDILGAVVIAFLYALCPSDQIESGLCVASWFRSSARIITTVCVGLTSILVVLVPALVAPAHRRAVAFFAYCGVAAFVLVLDSTPEQRSADLRLLLTGLAGLLLACWLTRRADPRRRRDLDPDGRREHLRL